MLKVISKLLFNMTITYVLRIVLYKMLIMPSVLRHLLSIWKVT